MEYRDERDLHIYTDGSSYSGPRRGGVGILYVSVDANGNEQVDPFPLPGYAGANNQEMEIRAAIDALKALNTRRAPVRPAPWRRIVIWTDSIFLVNGYPSARFTWSSNGWLTRDGNPVVNASLWQELLREAGRTGKQVEIEWVQGHRKSRHNKAADKLAKESAALQTGRRASIVKVRRKKTDRSVEAGSVEMLGQRLTIHIITDQYLAVQHLNRYKYEVMSKASPFSGQVDWIFSADDIALSAGHRYFVRVNRDKRAPRIVKVFREV